MRYLNSKNPRAARKATAAIFAASEKLADFPNVGRHYRGVPGNYRELVVPFGGEGYALLYRVLDDRVVIRNLKHQREATY